MGNLSSTPLSNDPHLWTILDPEMGRENLVEAKHRRLVRSHRTGPLDRELKPDARQRDELNVSVLSYLLMFPSPLCHP
jgi:phosphatidylinositol 3-kinase